MLRCNDWAISRLFFPCPMSFKTSNSRGLSWLSSTFKVVSLGLKLANTLGAIAELN